MTPAVRSLAKHASQVTFTQVVNLYSLPLQFDKQPEHIVELPTHTMAPHIVVAHIHDVVDHIVQ